MKREVIFILFTIFIFTSCKEKIKRVIEPGQNIESEQKETLEKPEKTEVMTLERIAEIANNGELQSHFQEMESENQMINEGMDKVKVIWINRGKKDEIRIDFRPTDSLKVFRVTARGRENPIASKTGLKPGMSIDQVNSLNRKPVDFFGFNWDFGGVAKFNDGVLENKHVLVYFKTDKKVGKQFIGDEPHSFEEAKQANLDLYVNKIVYAPTKNNQL